MTIIITREFTYVSEDESEQGYSGLKANWLPDWFDPVNGISIFHDMLEHCDDDEGHQYQEIMALAAAYYTRIETGYLNQITEHHKNNVSRMQQFLWSFIWNEFDEERPYDIPPPPKGVESLDNYHLFLLASQLAINTHTTYKSFPDDAIPHTAGWCAHGYRLAEKRFGCCPDVIHLMNEFDRLWEQNYPARTLRDLVLTHGDLITVKVDLHRCDVKFLVHGEYILEDYLEGDLEHGN